MQHICSLTQISDEHTSLMSNVCISCLCPHFHLNDTQLFLDLWVDRWASFRFPLFKGSSSHRCKPLWINHLLKHGEMNKLMLIICTKPTVNSGFGVLEKRFLTVSWQFACLLHDDDFINVQLRTDSKNTELWAVLWCKSRSNVLKLWKSDGCGRSPRQHYANMGHR